MADFDKYGLDLGAPDALGNEAGKLRRSCEHCRSSKGRCCPSTKDDDSRCQRCSKEGKQCVFLRAKPRPKRSKNSRTRVAEMEQKLESLVALLSANSNGSKEATPPAITSTEVIPPFSFEKTPPTFQSPYGAAAHKATSHFPVFALPFLVFDDIQDVISKGVVSLERAQKSLDFYRSKTASFPFVYISPDCSLDRLRREKPFLLHAILTCGAQSNLKLQQALELELRELLSRKMLIAGEKSMDLLQGLLVYLAWYHLYYNPETQQVYQLSQMVATMAVEMGIHRRTQDRTSGNKFSLSSVSASRSSKQELESMRTFAGCYYNASAVSAGLRKPNLLAYNDYIEECGAILASAGYVQTDHLICHFLRLQKFTEEVSNAFEYDNTFRLQYLDPLRVEILLKTFQQQLNEIGHSFPTDVWENVAITMAYQTNKVYLHEVGFHASIPNRFENVADYQDWYFSSARSDALIACLQATRECLDRLLARPSEELLSFTIYEFVRLIYTVLVLGRFNIGCNSPTLDTTEIRRQASFEPYIIKLITMTDPLITVSEGEERMNYIWHLRRLFQASKVWLDQVSSGALSSQFSENELCFMSLLPATHGFTHIDLAVSKYGCPTEDGSICTTLADWETSVDPSMVMLEDNLF